MELSSVVLGLLCVSILSHGRVVCSETWKMINDAIKKVKEMSSKVSTLVDSSLYAPSLKDYEQKCPHSTMVCFNGEMSVLHQELELEILRYLIKNLDALTRCITSSMAKSESGCDECEVHTEVSAEVFLFNLQQVIQRINSDNLPC